jgi:hypothetical protein
MNDDLVYVPGGDESFVPLSRSKSGRIFRKHILSKGTLHYPGVRGGKVEITDEFMAKLSENFDNKVCPIVQTPVVGDNNAHSEDPFRNIGEVVGLEVQDGKLYSLIDARDEAAASKLGKTLIGASAMLSLDYTDTRTGKKAGPALLHVAITNRPHLTELDDFEEVLAASAAGVSDSTTKAVYLTAADNNPKEGSKMELDELIAVARDEHGINIPELQKAAAGAGSIAKLSADLQAALTETGVLKLSAAEGENPTAEDLVSAVTQIAQDRVELSAKVDTLIQESATAKAEARIDDLVKTGFIAPAKRDSQLKLLLSNADLFEEILPEKPLVELSAETGEDLKDLTHDETVNQEIARLSAL